MQRALTKLTRLELECHIIDAPAGGVLDGGLSSLVHLQHLDVEQMPRPGARWADSDSVAGLSSATLPCLQQLTYLKFAYLSTENLLQLHGLSSLQELHLLAADEPAIGPNSMPGLLLPASLSTLVLLSPVETGHVFGPHGARGLAGGGA